MNKDEDPARPYPMRVVTRRTGLSPDVLRVWERRYGVVNPTRSEGGQRLYSAQDVERLTRLSRLVRAGHRIATLAHLPDQELSRLEAEAPAGAPIDHRARQVVVDAVDAVSRFDDERLEHLLRSSALTWTPRDWIEQVVRPFLEEVGERWHAGAITPAHEHLASATARDVLAWALLSLERAGSAPVIVMGTPAGELHELGAMMAAVIAAESGWRVKYLGPNLPAVVLADCARAVGASAIGLSVIHAAENPVIAEVRALRRLLPASLAVIVGGRGAQLRVASLQADGVLVAADASALQGHLDALQRE